MMRLQDFFMVNLLIQISNKMETKTKQELIIEKQRELIAILELWFDTDCLGDINQIKKLKSELSALESQEELKPTIADKAPIDQIREAFEPIQMGADMVREPQKQEEVKLSHCPECGYATHNGHIRGCQQPATPVSGDIKSAPGKENNQ